MNQPTASRLSVKHPENSLHQRLRTEVGLSKAQADAGVEIFLDWANTNYNNCRPAGQIIYTAVSAEEPAGKPVSACQTVEVNLTIHHRHDAGLKQDCGAQGLRQAKVMRLCWEAYEQGALLSQEDLAVILDYDRSTIKRLVKRLTARGWLVPTRGVVHDMGRAPSHKEQIGRLLCRGYLYTEICAMTGHTERSIERYALDLGRVIALADLGSAPNDIRIICQLSEVAVAIYLQLYREHNTDEFRQHLDRLKRRFETGTGIVGPGQYPANRKTSSAIERLRANDFFRAVSLQLRQDLDLTEPVADLVAGHIVALNDKVAMGRDQLSPGQTVMLVDSAASAPKVSGQAASIRPLVPVVLSPWTADKLDILDSERSTQDKLGLIADALAREARAQGGTMTVACLAVLLRTSPSAMAAALSHLRLQQEDPTPIKGITEDAGATQTHKNIICDLQDQGYTPPEISVITLHTPESRDRYLKGDLRTEALIKVLEGIPDEVRASRFLGMPRSVTRQYLARFRRKHVEEDASEAKSNPDGDGNAQDNQPSPQAVS
jgi:hypothetical protein